MSNGDLVSASDWLKGIGFSILASIVGGCGKLLIRKSWLMIETTSSVSQSDDSTPYQLIQSQKVPWATVLRAMGMIAMILINPLFCIMALQYASPSILAPFSGLTLVWIILFSDLTIGEKPLNKQIFAAALIILGEVLVAVWGDHTNDDGITVQHVIQSYRNISFQIYFVGLMLWMYFLYTLIEYSSPSQVLRRRLGWGLSGGSINGLQNFLKDALTVIKVSHHNNDVPFPFKLVAILLLMAAISAFSGLMLLTACMKRYNALFSSAMFVGSFVISASIMSAVHYNTFQHMKTTLDDFFYCLGLLLLLVGVSILVEDSFEKELDTMNDDEDNAIIHSTYPAISPIPYNSSFSRQRLNEPLVRSIT